MTNNIERRLKEHNDLKVKYSRAHAPWKLVLTIEKEGKTEALQLERKLKNLSRDRLVMFIKKYA
jgi:putative endonuclease